MSDTNESDIADLLNEAKDLGALSFGDFTLKSGRPSPYFFNSGKLSTDTALATLSKLFAREVAKLAEKFNAKDIVLLGLPYKGISLAALTCVALANNKQGKKYNFAYLRKEAKAHGEKSMLVGDIKKNQLLILIDDVLTAGTAVKESLQILNGLDIKPKALLIFFNREERVSADDDRSAIEMISADFDLEVASVTSATDLLKVVDDEGQEKINEHLKNFKPQIKSSS